MWVGVCGSAIGDFGLATTDPEFTNTMTSMSMSKGTQANAGIIGTPQWIPPEVLNGGKWTAAGDRYSLAVVIFEILTREMPWSGVSQQQMMMQIAMGKTPLDNYYATHEPLPAIQDKIIRSSLVRLAENRPPPLEIVAVLGSMGGASAVKVAGEALSFQEISDLIASFQARASRLVGAAGAAQELQEEDTVARLMKTGAFGKSKEDAENTAAAMEDAECLMEELLDPEQVSDEDLSEYIPKKMQLKRFIKYRSGGSVSSSGGGSSSGASGSIGAAEEPLPPVSPFLQLHCPAPSFH